MDQVEIAGDGFAKLPVPRWAKFLRLVLHVSSFIFLTAVLFLTSEWRWLSFDGESYSTMSLVTVILFPCVAFFLTLLTYKLRFFSKLLRIHKDETYGGNLPLTKKIIALSLIIFLLTGTLLSIRKTFFIFPITNELAQVQYQIDPPQENEDLMPIYFWDYGTWFDPKWLNSFELVVPYEKGPPQKLLSRVYFQDKKTRKIILELHGKRPRSYDQKKIYGLFDAGVVTPAEWPLVFQLQKEAGIQYDKPEKLSLMTYLRPNSGATQAIGYKGRAFFWGPDGSVYQTNCPNDCPMARMLNLTTFPSDPKGSWNERHRWTVEKIKTLLAEQSHETLLQLYLVSLLTLDPRDPEAYFHLGKLAKNRDTAISAIRYGRDLGLENHKLAELQNVADKLPF